MKKSVLLGLLLIVGQMFAVGAAMADTMVWKFKSHHANIVDLQLYAPARNNVWPTTAQVWSLKDYEGHSVSISCVKGEKVCYGAWVRGTESSYWGGGRGNRKNCTSCCYICGNIETPLINLNR